MGIKQAIAKAAKCAGRATPVGVAGTAAGGPLLGVLGGARDFVACIAERDREKTKVEIRDAAMCTRLGGEPITQGCLFRYKAHLT